MRITALVLGIIGGVIGLIAALVAIIVGGTATALEADGGGTVTALGFAAFGLAVIGIVGGALAGKAPGWSAALLAVSGVGGFVAISAFWLLSGPLLLVGALFAFLGRRRERASVPALLG